MELEYDYTIRNTILEAKDLHVSYNGVEVLRDLDFKIHDIHRPNKTQGQVNAILAPSGMGKSVAFRCIAGLNQPTSGTVHISMDGSGNMVPVKAGLVGVVAQDYPLFNHLTVWDNVMMAARLKFDAKVSAEKTTSLLERFGLIDRRLNYPHQISGGQRQRVAIIQQMVCSGHLLLMDEPFSGLDILVKDQVQNLILDVASQNELNSLVITTHDIQSAISISDTILLLGRERDTAGNIIPGAKVRYTYNLMEMGLAWHPNISELPAFSELEKEIKARFKEL